MECRVSEYIWEVKIRGALRYFSMKYMEQALSVSIEVVSSASTTSIAASSARLMVWVWGLA
jgi:hypothetical protein